MKIKELENSINLLRSLPGISKKTAENICNFILQKDVEYVKKIFSSLIDLKYKLNFCGICNNLSFENIHCDICNDNKRNIKELCIVSNFSDINKINKLDIFNGLFFNIQNEIDARKKNIDNFDNTLKKLLKMIDRNKINSVLIATNMTINGEFTAFYISSYLKKIYKKIEIYRIASGIPLNALIDYIDLESLEQSIKNKTKI